MPSLNPKCKLCPLHEDVNTVCVAGEGPKHAEVMVVGEAPGADEDDEGRPFIGKSGQLLRNQLRRNDLTDVYITNVVKCRPPDNRAPETSEIKACKEYLLDEIERVAPKYVVALGATAAKTLFSGKSKVTQHHGAFVDDPKRAYRGYIAYHPAYTLRDPTKLPAFIQDLSRLSRAVHGEDRAPEAPWALLRRGNLAQFLREFEAAPEFSFDLETSRFFMHAPGGWINAMSIDLRDRTWVVPLMDYDPINKRRKWTPWRRGDAFKLLVQTLVEIQKRTEKRCVGHNGKFDNLWLLCITGVRFRLSFDTMLAHHLLDENADHDLKSLARSILDAPEYDLTTKEKTGYVVPRKLYRYSAYDAYYTRRIKKYLLRDLKEDELLLRLFFKLVMPGARAMEMVELTGKYINLAEWEEMTLKLESELGAIEAKLNEAAGYEINWDSPQQISKLLFDELGLEPTQYTPKGAPSTSEEALFDLKDEHPIANQLVEYREKAKFLGTYLYGLQENMVGPWLHVSYKIHGTVGGRYSSRIHSIPRDGSIRNRVDAPPGWSLWVADIQQAELRFAAELSGDLEMRRCFKEGIDIHWRTLMYCISAGYIGTQEYVDAVWDTAKKLGSVPRCTFADACEILLQAGPKKAKDANPIWGEGRYRAKALNFGFVYGMRENKFIELAKTDYGWEPSYDDAHAMREGYFELYQGLEPWHEKERKLCRLDGQNRTLSGRIRRLPAINSPDKYLRAEAERQAVNIRVQSFIGDYKTMALIEIQENLDPENAKIVGEHHDAILGIVRNGQEDGVLPGVRAVMRHPKLLETFRIKLDIPMESEIQIGPWGKGRVYNDPA